MFDYIKNVWRLWAKALGSKTGATDKEADTVAIYRTVLVLSSVFTNICIVAGIIKHWND